MDCKIIIYLFSWLVFPINFIFAVQKFDQRNSMNLGAEFFYQLWKSKNDKISEFTLPVTYIYTLNSQCQLYSVCAPLYSTYSKESDYHLISVSDIKLGGRLLILDNRWTVIFGINFPLGKNRLNEKELKTAQVLAIPAFNFRSSDPGQGFNIQAGICSAAQFEGFLFGWGAGFILRGGYHPFSQSSGIYNPGDELSVTLGFKTGAWKTDLLFIFHGSDTWESKKHFKPGTRVVMQFQYFKEFNRINLTFLASNRIKTKDKLFSDSAVLPQRILAGRDQFEIRGVLGYKLLQGNLVKGILDIRHGSQAQFKAGGALIMGIGMGADIKINPDVWCSGELGYFIGNVLINARKINASGVEVRGGIKVNL